MSVSRSNKDRHTHPIARGERQLKVGRGKPIEVKDLEKKNPNSLRFVVGHVINFFFDGARNAAVEAMRRVSGKYASDRPNPAVKIMTEDALGIFLHDDDHVEYWHIEAIAKSINLPAGALLLISRTYSLIRDGNQDAAGALAQGVRALADQLDDIAKTQTLSKTQIDDIVAGFAKALDLENAPKLWDART